MRTFLVSVACSSVLLVVPSATAKDFGPGDLLVCNVKRCAPIVKDDVLPLVGSFLYSGPPPAIRRQPPLGTPYYQLRFPNGYVTGIVATRRLDRFLSYGVHLERFGPDTWYAVPRGLARELARLTARLRPLGLTPAALARSR